MSPVLTSSAKVELWYRYVYLLPASMNFGAGAVTDVPTYTRLVCGS